MAYSQVGNTGRKAAQRRYPIYEDDLCDRCGGNRSLQRHHKDHNPLNNEPENVAILCVDCHGIEHRSVPPANCEICGIQFQPRRKRRKGRVLCGSRPCSTEMGRRSAERRWASRHAQTESDASVTPKSQSSQQQHSLSSHPDLSEAA